MHHDQSRGKRNTQKVGGNNNFRETWGECTETGKIGGEIRNLWSMTKKGDQKFWRMKIEKFFGKR